jgi:hypothetical protein
VPLLVMRLLMMSGANLEISMLRGSDRSRDGNHVSPCLKVAKQFGIIFCKTAIFTESRHQIS